MATNPSTPILVPMDPEEFWDRMKILIREELAAADVSGEKSGTRASEGLSYQPIFSMTQLCKLFDGASRTTIYEWIKSGKLKPRRLKRKMYFFWTDIEKMLNEEEQKE